MSEKAVNDIIKQEALKLFGWVVVLSSIAAMVGYTGWGMALALMVYIIINLQQLKKLQQWLLNPQKEQVPDGSGIWGDLFHRIYMLQKNELKARNNLLGIIQRARESVSAIKEAVVLVDGTGNLEWWNPSAQKLLGFQQETDLGQPIINLMRVPDFIRYFEQGNYEDALYLPSDIQQGLFLRITITLFGKNDKLLIAEDITRLHNLEEMRKDFVANISHELRTPLTVLSGYLETFLENAEDTQSRQYRALLQMSEQTQRMSNLVQDLLLLSRLENQSSIHEHLPILVPDFLQHIKMEAESYDPKKQHTITLSCSSDYKILGVETDLRSAFLNLLTNAIKYTPANGHIELSWYEDAEFMYFKVKDNGMGIDGKHIPRLTERFYRADAARSTQTGGTGLGLAIVKHVMLEHQGHLDISSTLGQGSRFICALPIVRKIID